MFAAEASAASTAFLPLMEKAFIIPLIMAGTFVFHLFFSKKLMKRFGEKAVSLIGILAIFVCFVLSVLIGIGWIQRTEHPPAHGTAEFAAADAACFGPSYVEEGHGGDAAEADHGTGSEAPAAEGDHSTDTPAEAPAAETEHSAGSGELAGGVELAAGGAEGGEAGAAEEHHEVPPVCASMTWFENGDDTYEAGTVVDGLSAMMLFTVTLISLLVHVYSTEYLKDDVRFTHYYAMLALFSASMLFYVLSSNTLQMLVGWELVGVCSFGLIGHWWEEKKNSDAALKAFLTNRVGDMGLIIGVIVLFFAAGANSFNVFHINKFAEAGGDKGLLFLGALCLFFGVTSKSGQFPLHTWLPDAMAGPTPVSALIHAATMVVAGVYLIARMFPTFYQGMDIGLGGNWAPIGNYVAIIGAVTALIGACLAFVQNDIKKVLAYSTVSQLGYMVMALGVGAWTAGIFHLFTHAMFKACLFLGAGSVSHACHHTFDMREMGGLKKIMPVTRWTFLLCTGALAGFPLMSGFWSKDEILAGAQQGQNGNPYYLMLAVGLFVGGLTAAYMTRAYYLTFEGEYRGHAHPHESPKVITVPLMILTFFAFIAIFFNIPSALAPEGIALRFEHYVEPTYNFVTDITHPKFNVLIAGASLLFAVTGAGIMWRYMTVGFAKGLTAKNGLARGAYAFLDNKYYLDNLYENVIRDSVKGPMARAAYWSNMRIFDGIVNGVGIVSRSVGNFTYKYLDQGGIDGAIHAAAGASGEGGRGLRAIFATGKVQQYGAWLFGGAVLFAGLIVLTVK